MAPASEPPRRRVAQDALDAFADSCRRGETALGDATAGGRVAFLAVCVDDTPPRGDAALRRWPHLAHYWVEAAAVASVRTHGGSAPAARMAGTRPVVKDARSRRVSLLSRTARSSRRAASSTAGGTARAATSFAARTAPRATTARTVRAALRGPRPSTCPTQLCRPLARDRARVVEKPRRLAPARRTDAMTAPHPPTTDEEPEARVIVDRQRDEAPRFSPCLFFVTLS
ncbi:hypothetical protein M885DRAFT_547409 [Pelagophyceae sp. CCMP2097]|nr:hypothetical protein M885DRAFT_547409 [Pelagophyceae sp. CCMP2097]